MKFAPVTAAACMLFALAGCGGAVTPYVEQPPEQLPEEPSRPAPPPPPEFPFETMLKHYNRCETPRTGLDTNQKPYRDMQGTLDDELTFLRAWIHQSYLWYREVPDLYPEDYSDPVDYFNDLKTPLLTASGQPKDKYHFTYDSNRWDELQNRGSSLGYGVTWARTSGNTLPRLWLATTVEPGSPADHAGLRRGDQLLEIDGVDFERANDSAAVATINAGLTPVAKGETHRFTVRRNGAAIAVSMASDTVDALPVKNVKVIDTASGKVGYLNFATHNGVSERLLFDAVTALKAAQVDDLVLDVRYNGGGYLYVASALAYMIAGPQATAGKVFERPIHNDKTRQQPEFPFFTKTYGFAAPQPAKAGLALPTLNLKRVTLLTSAGTCSASESIINSLRGVDVDVTLIGGQTCGKPYAFTPNPNCGTTYFAVEFQGVNAKGFGDFQDGFAPTCRVADDFAHEQGDPAEGMLAAALSRRQSGACPVQQSGLRASVRDLLPVRDPVEEIAITHERR
jgi:carboxyl-terminal processing protease